MNVCLHYSKNKEEAQEILNDGFLKVFRKLEQCKDPNAFKVLAPAIAHQFGDRFISENITVRILALDIIHLQEQSVQNTGEHKLELDDVLNVVQQLSPAYRIVFNLYIIEGFTHPEIAKKLGISVGTSKSNLAKARSKLKHLLGQRFAQQTKGQMIWKIKIWKNG